MNYKRNKRAVKASKIGKEIWKRVVGEKYYKVSNLGRVKSLDRVVIRSNGRKMSCKGRLLNPSRNTNGYLQVSIRKKHHYVHRLVMNAFCGPKLKGDETRHLNGDVANCKLYNLQYGTPADNFKDRVKHGVNGLDPYKLGRRVRT